jgi:hypothetical protein
MQNLFKVTYKVLDKKRVAYVLATSFSSCELKFNKQITVQNYIINIEILASEGIYGTPNPLIK